MTDTTPMTGIIGPTCGRRGCEGPRNPDDTSADVKLCEKCRGKTCTGCAVECAHYVLCPDCFGLEVTRLKMHILSELCNLVRKISNGNLTADECRRKLAEITDQVSAIEGAGV
jgi:hypothetical protein